VLQINTPEHPLRGLNTLISAVRTWHSPHVHLLPGSIIAQDAGNQREARRRSAWVSRRLRLLRAHGLIHKLPGTHRYQLTVGGRKAITAILTALNSTVKQLVAAA